jgi:hypothetical protein
MRSASTLFSKGYLTRQPSLFDSSLTPRFRIYYGHRELGFRTGGVAPGIR